MAAQRSPWARASRLGGLVQRQAMARQDEPILQFAARRMAQKTALEMRRHSSLQSIQLEAASYPSWATAELPRRRDSLEYGYCCRRGKRAEGGPEGRGLRRACLERSGTYEGYP